MRGTVWVLGDVTTDLTLAVERFPSEGGDAFATYRRMGTGGFGANVGIVLARLGLRPSLIATVGDDEWGRLAIASLIRHGVDVAPVRYDRTEPTHLTVIVVSGDGERTMLGHRGASAHAGHLPALDGLNRPPAALVLSGYALFGDERTAQARRALELAGEADTPVVLDLPTDLPRSVRAAVGELIDHIRILVVGGTEVCALTGVHEPATAAEALSHRGPTVVVTLGSDGCLAAGPDGVVAIPAVHVNPLDTTGAGDAFVAALTAGWLGGLGIPDVLVLANCFGAAATLVHGAGEGMPEPDHVLDLIGRTGGPGAAAAAWLDGAAAANRSGVALTHPGRRRRSP